MNMMLIPQKLLSLIKTTAFDFLWNGSERGKVKRSSIVADINSGGIRFPDIETIIKTQHITWVKRFLYSPYHPWKEILTWQLKEMGGVHALKNTSLPLISIKERVMTPYYKAEVKWTLATSKSNSFFSMKILKDRTAKRFSIPA